MTMQNRPAPWIRAAVLIVAVASLGLVMCHSERRVAQPPPPTQAQVAPVPDAPPPPPPRDQYFPATKAPGKW